DIDIHFADLGTPSQRGINEHSNGLLRKNGLPKVLDFNSVSQEEISHVAFRRNNIPRKSLNYQTPIECFMSYVGDKFDKSILFHLFLTNQKINTPHFLYLHDLKSYPKNLS